MTATGARLRVDPIACDGRGLCAEVLPELITLDDWGFPIIRAEDIPPGLRAGVAEAFRLCPRLALRLDRPGPRTTTRERAGLAPPPAAGRRRRFSPPAPLPGASARGPTSDARALPAAPRGGLAETGVSFCLPAGMASGGLTMEPSKQPRAAGTFGPCGPNVTG